MIVTKVDTQHELSKRPLWYPARIFMFGFNLKVFSAVIMRSLILLNDWIHGPRKFQRGGWSIWLFNPSKTLLSFKKIAESHFKTEWMNMSSLGSGRPHSFSNATVLWSWNINYIRNITHTHRAMNYMSLNFGSMNYGALVKIINLGASYLILYPTH